MTQMTSNHSAGADAGPVLAEYLDRLQKGEIERDEAQIEASIALDRLAHSLTTRPQPKAGLFRAFGFKSGASPKSCPGLYLYGAVGRGKTMLMDMFFETVPLQQKRRLHFHEFLAQTHDFIADARAQVDGDPMPAVAKRIAQDMQLLCFDELHVTDIADAMILSRLFTGLYERGVVVVATSNAHPDNLYKNGLNRQLFEPFIGLIHENMKILQVGASKDFRLDKLTGRKLYFSPADSEARKQLDAHWQRLTGHHPAAPMQLKVKGRTVDVPLASTGVARFSFADLCANPLGSLDYLCIAHEFHTLIIDDIPKLSRENRNEARRFINLIDTLYDSRVSLVASAQAEPHELYKSGDGSDLFERTASRLTEMRSDAYLKSRT